MPKNFDRYSSTVEAIAVLKPSSVSTFTLWSNSNLKLLYQIELNEKYIYSNSITEQSRAKKGAHGVYILNHMDGKLNISATGCSYTYTKEKRK